MVTATTGSGNSGHQRRQERRYLDKMVRATSPIMSPYFFATSLSSGGMSFQEAFGVSSLQYAGRHFEIPTHEQLNSPTIHFSSSDGVPSGDARIKSVVHHSGIGSEARSRAGMTCGRSFDKKLS